MGQIDSAECGAQHIANWFIDHFHNPERPLSSMRLLLSNEQGNVWASTKGPQQVEAATAVNFVTSYDEWLQTAIADPGSIQVLYFAGHGIGTMNEHSMICADYNAVEARHMEGAIDFNNVLWTTSTKSKASNVWIFVDSCRVTDLPQVINGEYGRKVDMRTGPLGRVGGPKISTIFATAPGGEAHGNPGQPSFFAEAIAKAFQLNAFDRRNGRHWGCFTDIAFKAISKQLERIYLREDIDLATQGAPEHWNADSDTFLHCLPPERLPKLMVDISCKPDTDNASHTIFWKQDGEENIQAPKGQVWRTELTPGNYYFGAIDENGDRCRDKEQLISLPFQYIFVD